MQNNATQQLRHLTGIEANTFQLHEMKKDIANMKAGINEITTKGIKIRSQKKPQLRGFSYSYQSSLSWLFTLFTIFCTNTLKNVSILFFEFSSFNLPSLLKVL